LPGRLGRADHGHGGLGDPHGNPERRCHPGARRQRHLKALAGNDVVYGGPGRRDRVSCGTGVDTARADSIDVLSGCEKRTIGAPPPLYAGSGDDRIDARDGEADFVSCGVGDDTVVADAGDRIRRGECERVRRG
jgi:hypothetical protein